MMRRDSVVRSRRIQRMNDGSQPHCSLSQENGVEALVEAERDAVTLRYTLYGKEACHSLEALEGLFG